MSHKDMEADGLVCYQRCRTMHVKAVHSKTHTNKLSATRMFLLYQVVLTVHCAIYADLQDISGCCVFLLHLAILGTTCIPVSAYLSVSAVLC